jgi:hypothetical protein
VPRATRHRALLTVRRWIAVSIGIESPASPPDEVGMCGKGVE